jgi:BirA family biotin operon repressor/biotin-[acetyl-CoA-carboxylase] ligase
MPFSLSPVATRAGYRLTAFDTIGSTNAEALERAAAGVPGPLWLVSKRQESGRGRRGRAWATEEGNLAATLLVTGDYELARAATLGFVAGLSLSDALGAILPEGRSISVGLDGADGTGAPEARARIELKWPNDVLAGGAKLAGILLESALLPGGRFAAAIGIGVNIVSHPGDLPYPATSLHAIGAAVTAEEVFLALSDAWLDNAGAWDEGRGLATIRERWLARAAGLGGEVAVRVDREVLRGTFETIDDDCRFVIRRNDGSMIRITAGDVHFGAVASAAAS